MITTGQVSLKVSMIVVN